MSKTTPKPWKLFRTASPNAATTHVLMQRETRQHLMYVTEAPGMGDQGAPNMRAVEAAPELVASLEELAFIVESVAHLQGREKDLLPAANKARALLDRITGAVGAAQT